MKKFLLLFALVAITASAAAQFKKAGSMEVIKRFNRGCIVLSKYTTNNSTTYYVTFRDQTITSFVHYLDPVKLGDKENAIKFFINMKNGWEDMNNGDEFSDLGLPDRQTGYCQNIFGTKCFCIVCDNLNHYGIIIKSVIPNIIDTIKNDQ